MKRNARCPIDRSLAKAEMLQPDKLVVKILEALPIYCFYKAKGCDVTGPKVFIDAHALICEFGSAPEEITAQLARPEAGPLSDFCLREGLHSNLLTRLFRLDQRLVIG